MNYGTRYVVASSEGEAHERALSMLHIKDLDIAQAIAAGRNGRDTCDPRCEYSVYKVETGIQLEKVDPS